MTNPDVRPCHLCPDLCVCGQVDGLGRPCHFGCQGQLPACERVAKLAEYPTRFAEVSGLSETPAPPTTERNTR